MYHGDIRLGDTIDIKFTTVNTSGAPTTVAGGLTVVAYPANSITEITAGITPIVDLDARTGLHNVRVVATGANGYLTATNYALVVSVGTVGGTSIVGYQVGSFSIEARSALMSTTAANKTLDVTATGEAGIDWANIGTPGSTQSLSATTVATVTTTTTATNVTTVNGLAANTITAAAIAVGAIAADAFVAGAIDNAAFNVTETLTANPATGGIVAASFGAGAIDNAAFNVTETLTANPAAGGITAASFGAGAIDAAALNADAANEILGAVGGTADSGSTTTIVDTERTEADTDYWVGSLVTFTSGTLNGQTRLVTAFNAATDTITFAPATTVAVGTHTYRLLPHGRVDLHLWLGVLANALISGRVDASVGAMAADTITASAMAVGAIAADAFAAGAIDNAAFNVTETLTANPATGGIVAASFGAGAIDNAAFNVTETLTANPATGGIVAASFGAGAIDAAAIATDAIGATELAAGAANKIADSTLRRTYANARASADGDAVNFRSLLGAVGKLINKWSISGSTLTVFQEDDVTSTAPGGTQTVTGTAGADPITTLDTV